MPLFYLFLKIINKIGLNVIFYPIIYLYNFYKCDLLPNLNDAKQCIIDNNTHNVIKDIKDYKFKDIENYKLDDYKYDLQIIIPVYNSGKYIKTCLNSILRQKTTYSYQIIVVNDGSTDNTPKILSEYTNNSLIHIINQKNLGRSGARNTGLHFINSDYVMFVDSDDKLPVNSIQHLLDYAFEYNSDMVFGGYYKFNNNNKIKDVEVYKNCNHVYMNSSDSVNGFLCGKVFNSSLFKHVQFPLGYEFEDTILAFWIYPKCNNISSIAPVVYYYRDNPNSISNNFNHGSVSVDSFLITYFILKMLPKYNIKIDQYIYNTFLAQVKMNCLRNIYENIRIQKSIFVLTSVLYTKYFSNFNTNINYYKPLEKSLNQRNYNNYVLYCILK